MVVVCAVIVFLFSSNGYSDPTNIVQGFKKKEQIKLLEEKIKNHENKIRSMEEKQSLSIIFDSYRIGMVGIILSVAGLIVVIVLAFMAFIAVKSSKDIKDMVENMSNNLSSSNEILKKMEQRKEDIDLFLDKVETNLILMIDQILLSLSKLAEEKRYYHSELCLDQAKNDVNLETLILILCNNLKMEQDTFGKILYQVNLFHPDKEKVKTALMTLPQQPKLVDISLIKKAKDSIMSDDNKKMADAAIRKIEKEFR